MQRDSSLYSCPLDPPSSDFAISVVRASMQGVLRAANFRQPRLRLTLLFVLSQLFRRPSWTNTAAPPDRWSPFFTLDIDRQCDHGSPSISSCDDLLIWLFSLIEAEVALYIAFTSLFFFLSVGPACNCERWRVPPPCFRPIDPSATWFQLTLGLAPLFNRGFPSSQCSCSFSCPLRFIAGLSCSPWALVPIAPHLTVFASDLPPD